MRLVITTEGEQLRQEFLKENYITRLNESSLLENSMKEEEFDMISPKQKLKKIGTNVIGGRPTEGFSVKNQVHKSGRNAFNQEYRSYL